MADDAAFDVIVIGTGLTESITAAALAKAGFKVAQLDANEYYGGAQASLAADELAAWATQHAHATAGGAPPFARHYALSLHPALLPSTGPFLSALVASGVSRYGAYRLLERVAIYDNGSLRSVPAAKEDVFRAPDLALLDKRRLMRFLVFAASAFEDKAELAGMQDAPFVAFLSAKFALGDKLAHAIAYALAFCASADEPTLPTLTRLRAYLHSAGRYGPSPFLVGHYGGLGEIAQGFCRAAAVAGAVYVLGRTEISVTRADGRYAFTLNDVPDTLTADVVLSAPDLLPANLPPPPPPSPASAGAEAADEAVARAVLILDGPLVFPGSSTPASAEESEGQEGDSEDEQPAVDTAVVVFPPGSLAASANAPDAAVHCFITGQGTMSAPAGKYVLYLSTPVPSGSDADAEPDARALLAPYVDALLATCPTPPARLFEVYYVQRHPPTSPESQAPATPQTQTQTLFTTPPLPLRGLATAPDAAATTAETLFFDIARAMRALRPAHPAFQPDDDEAGATGQDAPEGKAETGEAEEGAGRDVFAELKFWPPVPAQDENDEDEW